MVNGKVVARALILGTLCLTTALSQAQTPPSRSIKIGYIGDLTGNGSFLSVHTQRGALVAQELLAKNRVTHGGDDTDLKVSIIFEDTGGKVSNALSAAMKLLESDHVAAVVCDLTALCTAIAHKVESAGKILIYHSPATSISTAHPHAFRNFIDYSTGCRMMAQHWKDQGIAAVGSLNANLEFGQMCYEGAEDVFKGHFSYRNNPGDDLRSVPLEFKKRGLKQILFTGFENDLVSWLKFSHAQGIAVEPGFIEILLNDSLLQQLGELPLQGIAAGFPEVSNEFRKELDGKYLGFGDTNAVSAALGFNAIRSLVEAFGSCEESNIECLVGKLREPKSGWLLGFRGWVGGEAAYPVVLKRVRGRRVETL